MDIGFRDAGFGCVWANEKDFDACETYRRNLGSEIVHGNLEEHIGDLTPRVGRGAVDCVFGGPPCQGFSVAGKMDPKDPRSELLWSYMQAVDVIRPRAFVIENVRALAVLEKFQSVRDRLRQTAREMGYSVQMVVLRASDFGVPQLRERVFFVGVSDSWLGGRSFDFLKTVNFFRVHAPTVREVFALLGSAGTTKNPDTCKAKISPASYPVLRRSPYAGMLFNGQGRPLKLDSHAATLPASMGGNRTPIVDEAALFEGQAPWVEAYHRQLMSGGLPCKIEEIPKTLRRLTIEEAKALQTFPSEFRFYGPVSSVYRQIGNAVPCLLARAVALALRSILNEEAFVAYAPELALLQQTLPLGSAR